jgi:hypothetical protein
MPSTNHGRFYGSSILFIYDGGELDKAVAVAKMVDFAHVVRIRDGGKDDSYKFGLYTLLSHFQNIKEGGSDVKDRG